MVDVVMNNLDKIIEACKQMQVKRLYLFGSGSRRFDFDYSDSDLDFMFQFINGKDGLPIAGYDYFDLLFMLEEITGRKIDLVAEERISNKYFLESINKDKIRIYEA